MSVDCRDLSIVVTREDAASPTMFMPTCSCLAAPSAARCLLSVLRSTSRTEQTQAIYSRAHTPVGPTPSVSRFLHGDAQRYTVFVFLEAIECEGMVRVLSRGGKVIELFIAGRPGMDIDRIVGRPGMENDRIVCWSMLGK